MGSSIGIEVAIDTAVYDATDEYNPGPNVVFINDSHGYVFFQKTNGERGEIVYYKTTDNGSSWSDPINIDCGPPRYTFRSFSCWYDQWTPNNTGTKIHIIANGFDNDEMIYNYLNTSDDSTNGTWTSVMASSGAHNAPDGGGAVTISTEGYIFGASWMTDGPQFGKYITSWSDITPTYTFLDDDDDHGQLLPLSEGDILCLYEDSTANSLYSFVYNEMTDSWDSSAKIVTNITSEETIGLEDANWGAVLDPSTHNVYLMLNNDILDAGGDLETWIFFDNNRSWSQKTNIVTDIGIDGDEVKPAYDYARNTLFAVYIQGNDIFVKNSTDGGGTWGIAQKVTTASREWIVIRTNFFSINRIYVIYFDEQNNDVFGNTVADLKIGPKNATIRVNVKDLDNRDVPNAQVNLTDSESPELTWTQNTTSGGYTIFINLPFSFYNITVEYEDSINDTLTFLEVVGEDPYETDPQFEFTVIISEYVDNSPPTVENVYFDNASKTFFADVLDESAISTVFLNLTAINLTDASVCINPTKFIMVEQTENQYYNATALNTLTNNDVKVFYNIIASDIANNTRVTVIKSLNLQDIIPPIIHEYNVNDYGNGTLQFYANITDSSFVQDPVELKINENLVQMHLNSSGYWIYRTQAFYGKPLNYTIYSVNDSVGNENGSKVHSLLPPYKIVTPSDNVPPVIWGTTDTFHNHQKGYVNFSTNIDDWNDYQSGVNSSEVNIILSINNVNLTYPMESIEEERYYFEFSFEFNDNITYWITAIDLARNKHPGYPHNYSIIEDNAIPDVTFEAKEFGNSTVEFTATVIDWPKNQTIVTLYFTQDYFGTWMNTSMINVTENIYNIRLQNFDYNRYDVWYYVIANDTAFNSFQPSPDQYSKVELTDKVSPEVAFTITNSSENDGEITITAWAIDSYGRTPYINNTFYINITTLEGNLTSEMEYDAFNYYTFTRSFKYSEHVSILVYTMDDAGNVGKTNRTIIIVDVAPPKIGSPDVIDYQNGTISIRVEITEDPNGSGLPSDNSSIILNYIFISSHEINMGWSGLGNMFESSISMFEPGDTLVFNISVVDNAGNPNSIPLQSYTISDETEPEILGYDYSETHNTSYSSILKFWVKATDPFGTITDVKISIYDLNQSKWITQAESLNFNDSHYLYSINLTCTHIFNYTISVHDGWNTVSIDGSNKSLNFLPPKIVEYGIKFDPSSEYAGQIQFYLEVYNPSEENINVTLSVLDETEAVWILHEFLLNNTFLNLSNIVYYTYLELTTNLYQHCITFTFQVVDYGVIKGYYHFEDFFDSRIMEDNWGPVIHQQGIEDFGNGTLRVWANVSDWGSGVAEVFLDYFPPNILNSLVGLGAEPQLETVPMYFNGSLYVVILSFSTSGTLEGFIRAIDHTGLSSQLVELSEEPYSFDIQKNTIEWSEIIPLLIIVGVIPVLLMTLAILLRRHQQNRAMIQKRKQKEIVDKISDIFSLRAIFCRNQFGLAFYTENFAGRDQDEDIIAGLTSAMSTMVTEIAQREIKSGEFDTLERERFSILSYHGECVIISVISEEKLSSFMKSKMKELANKIEAQFAKEELEAAVIGIEEKIKRLIYETLPMGLLQPLTVNHRLLKEKEKQFKKNERKWFRFLNKIPSVIDGQYVFYAMTFISTFSAQGIPIVKSFHFLDCCYNLGIICNISDVNSGPLGSIDSSLAT